MSNLRVKVSPLTNIIYAGSLIKNGTLWGANQTDVTSDVIGAIINYVGDDQKITVNKDSKPAYEISVRKIKEETK